MARIKKDKGITISPKHGVNPSVLHCICCGSTYGVAMLGKLKGDAEAPKDIWDGLCKDCQGVIDQGGTMFIEVKDGETGKNPYRTGRIIGVSKEFKENNHIEQPIMYMEEHIFEPLLANTSKRIRRIKKLRGMYHE